MPALPVHNILFLDIETVSQYASYTHLNDEWKKLWGLKAQYLVKVKEVDTAETLYGRSAIYAEFGKIICISCGFISGSGELKKLVIKSFYGDNEIEILTAFSEMLQKWSGDQSKCLCAHNGKEFDFPYLCRRLIINKLPIPPLLNMSGKKPWEINHYDTMDLWKFGDFKNFTSLNLLANVLGIQTPKDDIDGSMVGDVYWKEKDLKRIVTYCQKDVVTVAQVLLRMHNEAPIEEKNIEFKN